MFRPAACKNVKLVDSLSECTPGPTNISIAELVVHKKTPIASPPPAPHQTLPSLTLFHINWNNDCLLKLLTGGGPTWLSFVDHTIMIDLIR